MNKPVTEAEMIDAVDEAHWISVLEQEKMTDDDRRVAEYCLALLRALAEKDAELATAKAKIERLQAKLDKAPHAEDCAFVVSNWHRDCNCWKGEPNE